MIRSRSISYVCAGLLVLNCITASSTAFAQKSAVEELARVLPDDVLALVATSGGESLKPGFEKSIIGRTWNDPGLRAFAKSIKEAVAPKIEQEMDNPETMATIKDVLDYAKLVLGRPVAIGAVRKAAGQGPPVYGFAILNAGPRKAEIAAALDKLESLADEGDIVDVTVGTFKMHAPSDADDVPVYWGWVGNHFVVAVNDRDGLAVKNLSSPRAATPAYLSVVPGTDDAIVVHLDVESVVGIVTGLIQAEASADEAEQVELVQSVLKQLGISNVRAVTVRAGFDGPDVVSNALIEMPTPRTGLFAHLKPIGMATFAFVDAGAMNATALNCDLGGMYDTVLGVIKTAAGEDFAEVEQAIAEAEAELKFKIRQGLVESLSGEMLFYSRPGGASALSPMGEFVLVARLKNKKLWEESMAALGEFAAAKSGGMVQVSSQEQGGRTVHTWGIAPLAMAQIMPTWTVVGKAVVIGSNPALCTQAVAQATSGGSSIRETERFKTATAGLPANLISLRYCDSKLQFTQLMTALQQLWPMATMMATRAELTLPMVLPNLSHIGQDMGVSIEYSWFDEHGLRSRYRGPGIEPGLGAVAGGALGMGVLMPALARTRQIAFRMVSGTNLSGIGKAILIYSNDHDDEFPPNLNVLLEEGLITGKSLESKNRPDGYDGPNFIYIPDQNMSMYPGNIVAYENPEFRSDGVNVLFLDSHVEWMKPDDFLRELEETYERLGRKMPKIKFKR